MFEKMPQQPQEEKKKEKVPPQELFGSNVFEVSESGELKRTSAESEKPKAKTEVPASITEEAQEYAKAKAFFARTPQEAEAIRQSATQEYIKLKKGEADRINALEQSRAAKRAKKPPEEVVELEEAA